MSRYNGSVSRGSEDDYPFAVELPVPEGGFGTQLDMMRGWAKEREVTWIVGRNRFIAGQFFQTWRFKTEKDADAFATTFGGGAPLEEAHREQRRARGARSDIIF
jgi:hypothetical protein